MNPSHSLKTPSLEDKIYKKILYFKTTSPGLLYYGNPMYLKEYHGPVMLHVQKHGTTMVLFVSWYFQWKEKKKLQDTVSVLPV